MFSEDLTGYVEVLTVLTLLCLADLLGTVSFIIGKSAIAASGLCAIVLSFSLFLAIIKNYSMNNYVLQKCQINDNFAACNRIELFLKIGSQK